MLSVAVKSKITNVVVTADLKQRVDVTKFNQYSWGLYDVKCYGGICGYVKDEMMEGRVTVFFSGKLICVGAKSVKSAKREINHAVVLMLDAQLVKPVEMKITIRNIVGVIDVNQILDINHLAKELPHSIYEPEQFPSLIHRTALGPTMLIFSSGKIVVAGAKSEKQIEEVGKIFCKYLDCLEKISSN